MTETAGRRNEAIGIIGTVLLTFAASSGGSGERSPKTAHCRHVSAGSASHEARGTGVGREIYITAGGEKRQSGAQI